MPERRPAGGPGEEPVAIGTGAWSRSVASCGNRDNTYIPGGSMTEPETDDDDSILNPPLAYRNHEFLDSDPARPIRILAEYLQPMEVFEQEKISDTIVFFGSARLAEDGPLGRYYAEARELARLVTAWSLSLVSPAQRFIVSTGGGPG